MNSVTVQNTPVLIAAQTPPPRPSLRPQDSVEMQVVITDSEENQDKENRQNGFSITIKNKNF